MKPYDDRKYSPAKGLIPLMAVIQHKKAKVRPIMNLRELNAHVDALTVSADVCADKIREWRQQGTNVTVYTSARPTCSCKFMNLHGRSRRSFSAHGGTASLGWASG